MTVKLDLYELKIIKGGGTGLSVEEILPGDASITTVETGVSGQELGGEAISTCALVLGPERPRTRRVGRVCLREGYGRED